ncbi:MAG: biotin--[acetyl-CoA-carboxylase] ligase [Anaerolineae bacterium]|nr:biotin--[acetyl-CoA-carboxylase] ligase [Anaerolineae bacterium]
MSNISLAEEYIQSVLETRVLGRPTRYHPSIGSTMDEARRLAEAGAAEGLVVLADEQTAGRGRLDRRWWAPPGTCLLLTLLLRPALPARQAQRLTMICSLAVCDALAEVGGVQAQVKWPNDVLVGDKKICGVLTELDLDGEMLNDALIGIGINVNVNLSTAPELMAPATSVLVETGRRVSRLALLAALLSNLEARYDALKVGVSPHQEWAARMTTLRQQVRAAGADETVEGVAVGVDEDGALLVQVANGSIQRVLAGDVTLRGH